MSLDEFGTGINNPIDIAFGRVSENKNTPTLGTGHSPSQLKIDVSRNVKICYLVSNNNAPFWKCPTRLSTA